MNKSLVLSCIYLIWVGSALQAQEEFKQAYESSKNGQFDQAALIYENSIQQKGPSADLLYNLGTAYLNSNRIAEARIALEKAHRMEPANKQIRNQLEIIKRKIDPQIEALPAFLPYQWFIYVRDQWTAIGWGWLFLVLTYFTFGLLVVRQTGKKTNTTQRVIYILLAGLFTSGLLYCSSIKHQHENFYILMSDQPMRIAPDSLSQVVIPLGKGSKTEVIDSLGIWYKVILENNDRGWLPKSNLKN